MHGPGIMLKVTGSAMPGPLSLLPFAVHAADRDGEDEPSAPVHRDELSLYAAPPQQESRYVEPEAGQLEECVATLRKSVEPYTDWCRGTYDKIKPGVQRVTRFGNDAYAYVKKPPEDFYPRAGLIGFTGVLGLFLARGSRIKRLVYPAGLMTVSTSMYYPEQAAGIARAAGESVYDRAVRGYASAEELLRPGRKSKEGTEPGPEP